MNSKALTQVLTTHGKGTEQGKAIAIPEESMVTLYANFGGESLIVGGIQRVEMLDDMVVATTRKKEAFVIACEDIRAMRFGKGASGKRTGLI